MREISTPLRARRALPRHNARHVHAASSRARGVHTAVSLSRPGPSPASSADSPKAPFQNARPPVATRAMSDSSAQRVRVGPFAVSVDKQKPLIGAKISKGIVYAPWNATVNVGAFADLHAKSLSAFVRGEMDAGRYGTLVADVEGVELQKEWTLERSSSGGAESKGASLFSKWPEWARTSVCVSAGVGLQRESRGAPFDFKPRPYLNVDLRPTERNAKGAMVTLSLAQNQPVDVRPAYQVDRNMSLEFPVTVTGHHSRKDDGEGTTRDDLCFNAHLHGVVACYKMDNVKIGEDGESPLTQQRKPRADTKAKKK